ncbi:MAG: phospho-N-acetylmuramoyl-pentapeptide-transferase [Eubacterium sp.]|nr:phospho-N-acetylmuramoyl-pentapeptide-transferase [Eubacterium sp.]
MLYPLLSSHMSDTVITMIGALIASIVTFVLYRHPAGFLPKDHGKVVTDPNGNIIPINTKSKGKITGAGFIFVLVFLISSLLFLPVTVERVLYIVLCFIMMFIGFLDDCAKAPWGELIKGILDLFLAVAGSVIFVFFNDMTVTFFGNSFVMNKVVYVILGTMLIWGSINVTNCSDGVDGLCGGVSVIELTTFFLLFEGYGNMGIILAAVLLAYLYYNWFPSKILMGDAGSRTIGFFIAILAMKSGHPYAFILLSLVFLVDGGLGLVKLTLLRTLHLNVFGKIRFPLHDEFRKNRGWKVPRISLFFAVCEIVMCFVTWLIVR